MPAVILGAMLLLLATGATLNLQSYMGIIMSTGVSVANALLIVTNAEKLRLNEGSFQGGHYQRQHPASTDHDDQYRDDRE